MMRRLLITVALFAAALSSPAEAQENPFYGAEFQANRQVKKAYEAIDYGKVAEIRKAFLATWGEKAPAEDRARRALERAEKEAAAARKLAAAWKKVEASPKKHLLTFLKTWRKVDVRRHYTEPERHAFYDLLQQVSAGARAWKAARFPAVIEGEPGMAAQDLDELRSNLVKFFGEYGWKVTTAAGSEEKPRILTVGGKVEVPKVNLSQIFGTSGRSLTSYRASISAVIRGDDTRIDVQNVTGVGLAITELQGHGAAMRDGALRLRTAFADALIEAAIADAL